MKKTVLVFLFMLLVQACCFANDTVLRGSVAYTVESAKKLAFDSVALKLDKDKIKPYLYDENNKENRDAIKNNLQIKDRYIMAFETAKGFVKGYVVVYDDKPEYAYYYSTSGYLVCIDVDDKSQNGIFPYTVGKYSAVTGNLVSVGFYISEDEQYSYSKDGKLKAHWVGSTGYNEKGRPIAVRNVLNEIPRE